VLNPQRLIQQAAQILSLLRRDEFHVKKQRHYFAKIHFKRKLPGVLGETNQKRTGNCECTRARGPMQQKVCEKMPRRASNSCGRWPGSEIIQHYGNKPRTSVASATRPTARIMAPARGGTWCLRIVSTIS
jgi:hypothetical protein